MNLLYVCTGNAARSVMATIATTHRAPDVAVRGAGTLSIPGLPMSRRTRAALRGIGLHDPGHRSAQLEAEDVAWATLIVTFEPQHIAYVRKHHPDAAAKTATLPRLLRELSPDGSQPVATRVAALGLADVIIEDWEEVIDPAGGDQAVFDACMQEISNGVDLLLARLIQDLPASR